MARLEEMLPPGEMVRWISPKDKLSWDNFVWGLLAGGGVAWFSSMLMDASEPDLLLLFAAIGLAGFGLLMLAMDVLLASDSEAAVTEGHVVWTSGALRFRLQIEQAGLRDIRAVDMEEGGDAAHLHRENETHRIELVSGSDLEAMGQAIGRPARIWRKCNSPAARRARRWQSHVGASVAAVTAGGTIALAFTIFGNDGVGRFIGAMAAALLAQWFSGMAQDTLPHFLVGRRLSGEARRDFVGWMTDPRWRGMKPDGPDDERLPRSRLEEWAMRKAYGEIPDTGEREPEILVRGDFPPDATPTPNSSSA